MPNKTMRVSLIHPDMFNNVIERNGIEGVEVFDGEDGLQMKVEEGAANGAISRLLNVALAHDVTMLLVLDSNVSHLKDVIHQLQEVSHPEFDYSKAERDEIMEMAVDTLDSIYRNLNDSVQEYRTKGAV